MKSCTYRGLILDFDGTLVDSEPLYFRANRDAFASYGHTIDEREYYHYWSLLGTGAEGEVERHGLIGIDLAQVKALSRSTYRRIIEEETPPLFPYARELLEELPLHGLKVVIASNTACDLIHRILSQAGFSVAPVPIIGGDGLNPKPAPDIFLAAWRDLKLEKKQCLVLEDTDKGVRAARAAGIPFAVIHSALYPDYAPADAVARFTDLKSFQQFLLNE